VIVNTHALVAFHIAYSYGEMGPAGFLANYDSVVRVLEGFDITCADLGAEIPARRDAVREAGEQLWAWRERAQNELAEANYMARERAEDEDARDDFERRHRAGLV
jgi:hypothetical protein